MDSLRGKRVLVTGHTGFKGSWLCLWLHRLGAQVYGFSLPALPGSNFERSDVRALLAGHFEADVRDRAALDRVVAEVGPDAVFHLAAQALVRAGYAQPVETFEVNLMGTIQLLDALRLAGQPCACVVVTSDKCYENREQVWGYRECDPMGGFDPYSASKGCAELATAAMRRSYGGLVRIASGRAGNVIGGGDVAADRLMVDVMRALAEGEPIRVRNPESVRPWQHVLDPLSGYLRLAARLLDSDDPCWQTGWNFGPRAGDELSVRQVVERAISAHGAGTWVDARDPAAPHEAAVLRLAIDKAVAELGWRPRWSADEAIARTAAWHLRVGRDRGAAREACLADIQAYESG